MRVLTQVGTVAGVAARFSTSRTSEARGACPAGDWSMRTWPEWGNRAQSAAVQGTTPEPVTYPATFSAVTGILLTFAPTVSIMVVVMAATSHWTAAELGV